MDILMDLPIRSEAIDDARHKRDRISLLDSDDSESEHTPKRVKKSLAIDGGQYKLGLNLQDDYFEIEEIQRRRLPREDGLEWNFIERTVKEEAKRPYGKTYLRDQINRQKDLSHNKNYRFINELAGALRKEFNDIIDPEDLDRLQREREEERLQTTIELNRTRISMDNKYDLIQKLRQMAKDEQANFNTLRGQDVPYYLTQLTRYLVDNKSLPATANNQRYGFLDLARLAKTYGDNEQQPRNDVTTELLNRTLGQSNRAELSQQLGVEGETLFFYLFTYYRDFLNNESTYSLTDSIRQKILYALDHYRELTTNGPPPKPVIEMDDDSEYEDDDTTISGSTPLPSTTTTTSTTSETPIQRERLDNYERQLRQALQTLSVPNPLELLERFEESGVSKRSAVNWRSYKERQTETINMDYFERMGISRDTEREMATRGLATATPYSTEAPEYVRSIIAFLYGSSTDRLRVTAGDRGLNILSGDVRDGGNPSEIDALIRIQFSDYDRITSNSNTLDGGNRDIETLIRSHFLFLFFDETPWLDIVTLLQAERATIVKNIRDVVAPLRVILDASITFYKAVLLYYLRKVAAILYTRNPPLITLPATAESILLGDNTFPSSLAVAARLFDELNESLKRIGIREIVNDELFYEYLATGNDAFLRHRFDDSRIGGSSITAGSGSGGARSPKPTSVIVNEEYPALILHDLLRAYNEYRREYLLLSSENLARINAAIDKGTKKIAEVVGDESYSVNNNSTNYRQRKSFTTKPENSGFIKLRAEIKYLIDRAYHLVMDYAPNLKGLPLDAFQGDSAYEAGLSVDFIDVIAVLAANREYSFPDGYRSQQQYKKINYDKHESMKRMRRYTWSGSICKGFSVHKDVNTTPFFATRVYAVPNFNNTHHVYRPTRIMF